jgi:hypothetical protein
MRSWETLIGGLARGLLPLLLPSRRATPLSYRKDYRAFPFHHLTLGLHYPRRVVPEKCAVAYIPLSALFWDAGRSRISALLG